MIGRSREVVEHRLGKRECSSEEKDQGGYEMKVSIIGLGALGIMFSNQLVKSMRQEDVRVIADYERIEKYKREGVFCNGERCYFNYVTPDEKVEPADLLLFTVKYSGLTDAISAVRKHVGENTIILSALNGISSEEMIGRVYGTDKVLYCVAQGMDAVKVGNQLTYENMGMLCFGDKEQGIVSEKTEWVKKFFEKVSFPFEVDTNMAKRQWGKFMLNVGVNQTIAVFKGNYGIIQQEGKARDMMIKAMKEVIALSEKEGVALTEDDLTYWLGVLETLSPDGKPSMAQDVEAKRYSEVDLFAGTVLKLGEKHNFPTPVNKQLFDWIKDIEASYEIES